jgi:hypothetical protein
VHSAVAAPPPRERTGRRAPRRFDPSTEERVRTLALAATAVLLAGSAGCRKKAQPAAPDPVPSAPTAPTVPQVARKANPVTVPPGWAEYAPPERDFSVVAPGAPRVETVPQQGDTVRLYTFRKGGTVLRVFVSERSGTRPQWAEPAGVRSDPAVVPGSIKELPASATFPRGLELRRTDPRDGLTVLRAYWSAGHSPDVALHVLKPDSVPESERRAFLDSFAYHGR